MEEQKKPVKRIRLPSIKITISVIACVATLSAVIYMAYLTHGDFEETVILHTQQQLLSTVETVAMNLEKFIVEHSTVLQVFSADPRFQEEVHNRIMHNKPETTYCPVKNFYEAHKIDIDALTLLDDKGTMLHRHPFIEDRPGTDHSDKPGVEYVIREHKRHISQVFCNNLGKPAISISEPIFYKGEFTGIVRWMIETATLSKRFIEPVKIGNDGYMWMFDDRDVVLSHPRKDFVGMSILDVIKKMHKERGELFDEDRTKEHILEEHDYLNKVKTEEEGYGVFVNCTTDENDIVAYKKVSIDGATLNLIMTLPYAGIAGPIYVHEKNIFVLAGLVVLLLGGGGVLFFKSEQKKTELKAERRHLKEITETADALRESEQKFRQLTDLLPQPIFEIDLDGNVTYSNRRGFETFGYSYDDLENGVNVFELFIAEERQRVRQNIRKKLIGEEFEDHEYTGLRKDGSTFPILVYSAPIITHNKPVGLRGIVIDITERKKASDEQVKRERLQGVIEIAGAVCHELSQPMQVISIYSQLLMADIRVNSSLFGNIKKIKKQIDRMEKIKNNLMRITRYESKDYLFYGEKIIDIDKASANDYKPSQKYI